MAATAVAAVDPMAERTFTPSVGFWNIHFTPGLSVSVCGGPGGVGFSSQGIEVDPTGQIRNTQWSPQTPSVSVTGQVTANQQVTLSISCLNNPGISTTATLPWQTTSFDGQITFSGVTTNAHVTGWSSQPAMPTPVFASGAAAIGNKAGRSRRRLSTTRPRASCRCSTSPPAAWQRGGVAVAS